MAFFADGNRIVAAHYWYLGFGGGGEANGASTILIMPSKTFAIDAIILDASRLSFFFLAFLHQTASCKADSADGSSTSLSFGGGGVGSLIGITFSP